MKIHATVPVFWFTGLSGSGKTTIAKHVSKQLIKLGVDHVLLDGDVLRKSHTKHLGFSREDRIENIKIAGSHAIKSAQEGKVVLATFITPYHEQREWLRANIPGYVEVFISTPLAVCEKRDVKGLYQKARAGEIENFTGIDSEFEVPSNAEIIIDTTKESVGQSAQKVLAYAKLYIPKC